ncbi:hypothetical protein [Martelella mediterranea]|uniref:Uncharacterized protein n=1 Tax=Martelella mediterranea TaxID=293089 RepID=A0A4R3NWU1_9HYPH|nr:hypothetical protein [Martelella mediterranea]TCT42042.1 hypothetical protein EDC90_100557 [Martelella mediterranea]
MTEERLQRLEAQLAAHQEVLIALAVSLPEGEAQTCFRAALDGLLTVKEQSEDPGLEPDGAFAHEYRFAETLRAIVEGAEARSNS